MSVEEDDGVHLYICGACNNLIFLEKLPEFRARHTLAVALDRPSTCQGRKLLKLKGYHHKWLRPGLKPIIQLVESMIRRMITVNRKSKKSDQYSGEFYTLGSHPSPNTVHGFPSASPHLSVCVCVCVLCVCVCVCARMYVCMCVWAQSGSVNYPQVHKHVLISLESIVGIHVPSNTRVHKCVLETLKIRLVIHNRILGYKFC